MSGTVREGAGGGTVREGVGGGTVREGSGGGFVRVSLLPCLQDRFHSLADLGGGGEADVLLVEDQAGVEWVVKQYRQAGWSPSQDVLDRLLEAREGSDRHSWGGGEQTAGVLWLEDWGVDPASGLFFEVQEYVTGGSLASGWGSWSPAELAEALCVTVTCFHQLVGAHRDIKPANVLVRDPAGPILVLADIGLSRDVGESSARYSRRDGSAAYQAPEASQGLVSRAGDWWAVGMILAEAALGFHPWARPDGSLLPDQVIQSELAQRGVPHLDGISDDRIRLLCQGLLTRDAQVRWRAPQVREWLTGGSPIVHESAGLGSPSAGAGTGPARLVLFGGQDYRTPPELAAAFADDPFTAGSALFEARDQVLREDLRLLLSAHGLHEAQSLIASYQSGPWQPTFLRLLTEMDPQLPPVLGGQNMSPTAIAEVATSVVSSGGANVEQGPALTWACQHDLWRIWRGLPGMQGAAEAAAALAQIDAPGYLDHFNNRCLVMDESNRTELESRPGHHEPKTIILDTDVVNSYTEAVTPLYLAWQLWVAVDPDAAGDAMKVTIDTARGRLTEQHWWREMSEGDIEEQLLAVTTIGLAEQARQPSANERWRRESEAERQKQERRQASRRSQIELEFNPRRQQLLNSRRRFQRLVDGPKEYWLAFWIIVPFVMYVYLSYWLGAAFAILCIVLLWSSPIICKTKVRSLDKELDRPLRFADPNYEWDSDVGDWVVKSRRKA